MESLLAHSFLTEVPVVAGAIVAAVVTATILTKAIVEKSQESEEEAVADSE